MRRRLRSRRVPREDALGDHHLVNLVGPVVDACAALGITSDTVLAHYYVHERGARIYDGPDEVHKMVVAKRILARYAP